MAVATYQQLLAANTKLDALSSQKKVSGCLLVGWTAPRPEPLSLFMPLVIDATDLAFESAAIEGHHSCHIDIPSRGLPRTWDEPAAHVVAVVQRAFGDN